MESRSQLYRLLAEMFSKAEKFWSGNWEKGRNRSELNSPFTMLIWSPLPACVRNY